MIVSAEGSTHSKSNVSSVATKIVCTTGTAYVRTTKLKVIVRAIKKVVKKVKTIYNKIKVVFIKLKSTLSGKTTTLAPPDLRVTP